MITEIPALNPSQIARVRQLTKEFYPNLTAEEGYGALAAQLAIKCGDSQYAKFGNAFFTRLRGKDGRR